VQQQWQQQVQQQLLQLVQQELQQGEQHQQVVEVLAVLPLAMTNQRERLGDVSREDIKRYG
jgi:hypothetical protein